MDIFIFPFSTVTTKTGTLLMVCLLTLVAGPSTVVRAQEKPKEVSGEVPPKALMPIPTLRDGTPHFYEDFVNDDTWPERRRVRLAKEKKEDVVQKLFSQSNIKFPPAQLLFRAFKKEEQLEVWANSEKDTHMTLVATYQFCETCGTLGPKRLEGDFQIPEGFYRARWHGTSDFFLAFRVTYPNRSDCILGDQREPGSDIMIHGSCVTVGCLPMGDGGISELWLMAKDFNRRKRDLHIHIFPARDIDALLKEPDCKHSVFWSNLKGGLDCFKDKRIPPKVCIDRQGKYLFAAPSARCPRHSKELEFRPAAAAECPR
jgi:murein L,D-transpeptidase YafK